MQDSPSKLAKPLSNGKKSLETHAYPSAAKIIRYKIKQYSNICNIFSGENFCQHLSLRKKPSIPPELRLKRLKMQFKIKFTASGNSIYICIRKVDGMAAARQIFGYSQTSK